MQEDAGKGQPIVLVAMGGHAFMQEGEQGTVEDHLRNADRIGEILMTLVERDYPLVVTHGNGPQVGNLLIQHEQARDTVPAMPLDATRRLARMFDLNLISFARAVFADDVVRPVSRVQHD